MSAQGLSGDPREILRSQVEQWVLGPLRSHGWSAAITREANRGPSIEVTADKGAVGTRIAVLYGSGGISTATYEQLRTQVDHIFFAFGDRSDLDSLTVDVTVPIDPIVDFLPFLIGLNKKVEPDQSPAVVPHPQKTVRRLTAENPLQAVMARLEQFTSVKLAERLVERRSTSVSSSLSSQQVSGKATGIAYSMRSALDYFSSTPVDKLNRRVIGLYYGTLAFSQAEMLASPSGPGDLDEVEEMTKQGHGLYTFPVQSDGFAGFRVGVLATGFMSRWMSFLGYDVSAYPKKKPRTLRDLCGLPDRMVCPLQDLFASIPEIDDLHAEVFGGQPGWISAAHDTLSNARTPALGPRVSKPTSTYAKLIDRSGKVPIASIENAGWPFAEIQEARHHEGEGRTFRVRVDHTGHEIWWSALPVHSSPYGKQATLLFPTLGGHREYRTIYIAA